MSHVPVELRARRNRIRFVNDIIVVAFGLFFLWAAVYKAVRPDESIAFANAFLDSPSRSDLLVKAVTVVELVVGSALLLDIHARAMVMGVLVLMVLFSAALVYAKRSGYAGTCGCVGIGTTLDHALVRNAILALVACATMWIPSPRDIT